jgi:capsular exopolysaccharide synthesis family protein
MSRVSDALERASAEGAQLISKSADARGQKLDEAVHVEKAANGSADLQTSGEARPVDLPEAVPEPSWSLVKRIQRRVFGRGLEKIKEFPLVLQEQNSLAGEQYKILREQVKRIYNDGDSRVLAIMSPVKGDGKSTVAANLAAVIALDYDQQILLIDADLRSPSIHNFFGMKSTPGLADYLSAGADANVANYVHNTSLNGLRVLPAGRPTHLSSELLATEKMKSLLREIPAKFPGHQVIIDTSPVLSTSDPLVLAQQVDKVLMVVRAGATPRECLSEAIKSLGRERVKGVILNGADLGRSSKYYYYYGRQS